MIERIIDLSQDAAKLSARTGQLVIESADREPVTVPLAEVAAVVLAHRQILMTHGALAGIAAEGGIVVACDEKSMPVGMLLPLARHHLQTERFAEQAAASEPVKKQAWKQIVEAKVAAQGRVLLDFHKDDRGLFALGKQVKSGDTGGIEGRAARKYWPVLFGDPRFKRDREAEDQNRFLNYGYAVLRAMTARAICAAGLHPSLGVHHHNRYDAFCLADDLMEPFRPIVDRAVVHLTYARGGNAPLDKDAKAALIGALLGRFDLEGESRTLFDILGRTAASLARMLAGETKTLILPGM